MDTVNRSEVNLLFDNLWRENEPYIRKLCSFKLQSTPDYIDDCVQEVFKALLVALNNGLTVNNPRAWLTRVAYNKIKDCYTDIRHQAQTQVSLEGPIIGVEHYAVSINTDELDDAAVQACLKELVDGFTQYERELFEDRYVKGQNGKDMASKRGITENLLRQQVFRLKHRLIKRLRLMLDDAS